MRKAEAKSLIRAPGKAAGRWPNALAISRLVCLLRRNVLGPFAVTRRETNGLAMACFDWLPNLFALSPYGSRPVTYWTCPSPSRL